MTRFLNFLTEPITLKLIFHHNGGLEKGIKQISKFGKHPEEGGVDPKIDRPQGNTVLFRLE